MHRITRHCPYSRLPGAACAAWLNFWAGTHRVPAFVPQQDQCEMRQPQKSNRARGRGGRKGGGGGGGGGSGTNLNRVYESAGPEGKVRGTPQQIVEKYLSLARDAQTSGDRVTAENFLQHAEHYQRIVLQALGSQEERRDQFQNDGDDDDDDDDGMQPAMGQQSRPQGQSGGEQRGQGGGEHRQQPEYRPQPDYRPQPEYRAQPEPRPQSEPRSHGGSRTGNGHDHQPGGEGAAPPRAVAKPQIVSPLTTIDLSDEGSPDLLVTTERPIERPAEAAPRRPRRPRNRRPAGDEGTAQGGDAPAAAPATNGDTD